jgi:hypothetical protein
MAWATLRSNPRFLRFFLAGVLSFAAPTAGLIVLSSEIVRSYGLGGSGPMYAALTLSFLGLSATIPTLGSAAVSGTLADRVNRLRLLRIVTIVALVALGGAIAVLSLRPDGQIAAPGPYGFYLPMWVLLAFPLWAALTSAVTIFRPTFNASLPRLLPATHLGRANGLIYAATVGAGVVTWLAVGPIDDAGYPQLALLLPLLLFAGSLVCLFLLSEELQEKPRRARRPFLSDAAEGYRYIGSRPELLALTFGSLGVNFLNALALVELSLLALDSLHQSITFLAALNAVASLGAGTGAYLIGRSRFEARSGRLIGLFILPMGAAVALLPVLGNPILVLVDMFFFGLFPGMVQTIFVAAVQATVPNRVLGRVFAADEMGSYGLVPVGQYAGGLLTVAVGLESTYLLSGIGTVGIGLALLLIPAVGRFGFQPAPERAAEGRTEEPTTAAAAVPVK